MARSSTHLIVGLLASIGMSVIHVYTSWHVVLMHAVSAVYGSILPDIDHAGSRIHRVLLFPRLYKKWKHWGHAHSIIAAFIGGLPFAAAAFFIGSGIQWWWVYASFVACYVIHLVLDEIYKAPGNKRKALKVW